MVGNWLYGVAYQTAIKARAMAAKRMAKEKQVAIMPEPQINDKELWNDLQPVLDQELSLLPDKYRVPIVMCDLEGRTRKLAARELGVPDGTLAARLSRGRTLLAKRLKNRGIVLPAGLLGMMLSLRAAPARRRRWSLPRSSRPACLPRDRWRLGPSPLRLRH